RRRHPLGLPAPDDPRGFHRLPGLTPDLAPLDTAPKRWRERPHVRLRVREDALVALRVGVLGVGGEEEDGPRRRAEANGPADFVEHVAGLALVEVHYSAHGGVRVLGQMGE